ncbi:PulJ/GspJ family protein [Tautonia sociabilis]|uniref:Prepilin-type N-terminal cleavage/methylation domain-containing protein n=1 Tax=Tautonia sociabilis TaxID=2080755 RepID=A0A432MKY5_9BACT|nr:hypothetical protein [Tautonia sociabilis]RUL88071.1 hypothetical protein TsocGM_09005 [Tautonia sociabilis]
MIARNRGRRRSDRRRGAASLIEVLAAMAVSSVLFLTTGTVMVLVFRLESTGRDELTATVAEGRLAADLRADVRSAAEVDRDGQGPADGLTLVAPDGGRVSYRSDGSDLVRTRAGGEGEPDRVDRYRLLPGTLSRWEVDGDRVSLVLDAPRRPKAEGGNRRVVRIETTIGRDLRFSGGAS